MAAIIRMNRLDKKDYIYTETKKSLIVLHHTVVGSARSAIDYWRSDQVRIGTVFVNLTIEARRYRDMTKFILLKYLTKFILLSIRA